MKKTHQKTTIETNEGANRAWVLIDVENQVVGRVASCISEILRGKHRPTFTPYAECGDYVIVTNASKIRFTGAKWDKKIYHHHSGFPGGMKNTAAGKMLEKHPEDVLKIAVWGMLPKSRLSHHLMKNLKVYPGAEHPHEAQKPTILKIENML